MISLLLLFPLIACLILFLIKNRPLNNVMLNIYAFIHFICSVSLCMNYNPLDINQHLFLVNNLNKIFLIVLSVVFIAVSI